MSCTDGHNKGQKQYGPNKLKILRRGDKNAQKNTKKIFITQINHDVVTTHLESDTWRP